MDFALLRQFPEFLRILENDGATGFVRSPVTRGIGDDRMAREWRICGNNNCLYVHALFLGLLGLVLLEPAFQQRLRSLQRLSLRGTFVTDAGLMNLRDLKQLRWMSQEPLSQKTRLWILKTLNQVDSLGGRTLNDRDKRDVRSFRQRYFFEAKESDAAGSHQALAFIRQLYAIEEEARPLDALARAALRQEQARPILDTFASWLDTQTTQPENPGLHE